EHGSISNTCETYNTCEECIVATSRNNGKQNLTISLDRQTIQKAKIIAARRSTSISELLSRQIEILIGEEEAYDRRERQAMPLRDFVASLTLPRTRNSSLPVLL